MCSKDVIIRANRAKTCCVYVLKIPEVIKSKWLLNSFRQKVILPQSIINMKTRKQMFNPWKRLLTCRNPCADLFQCLKYGILCNFHQRKIVLVEWKIADYILILNLEIEYFIMFDITEFIYWKKSWLEHNNHEKKKRERERDIIFNHTPSLINTQWIIWLTK